MHTRSSIRASRWRQPPRAAPRAGPTAAILPARLSCDLSPIFPNASTASSCNGPSSLGDTGNRLRRIGGLVVAKRLDDRAAKEILATRDVAGQRRPYLGIGAMCRQRAGQRRPHELGDLFVKRLEQLWHQRRARVPFEVREGDRAQPIVRIGAERVPSRRERAGPHMPTAAPARGIARIRLRAPVACRRAGTAICPGARRTTCEACARSAYRMRRVCRWQPPAALGRYGCVRRFRRRGRRGRLRETEAFRAPQRRQTDPGETPRHAAGRNEAGDGVDAGARGSWGDRVALRLDRLQRELQVCRLVARERHGVLAGVARCAVRRRRPCPTDSSRPSRLR